MSASLVGSEMCIRDRPRLLQCRDGWRPGALYGCRGRRPEGQVGVCGRACLLYTSDAADDM
eukprot:10541929-Alexandrium_andersonii.AAC.1